MKALLLMCAAMATCNPPKPNPVIVDAGPNPGIVDAGPNPGIDAGRKGHSCPASLQHLKDLGCNPRITWLEVCENDRPLGLFSLECIDNATSKETLVNVCKTECQ